MEDVICVCSKILLVFVIVPLLIGAVGGDDTCVCAADDVIFDVTEEEFVVVRLFADCADRSGS